LSFEPRHQVAVQLLLARQHASILRFVFWHSIALACLVGVLVMLQAYAPPFSSMVY
jgi:L-lactate permease